MVFLYKQKYIFDLVNYSIKLVINLNILGGDVMELTYKQKNGWSIINESNNLEEVFNYSEEYKDFLNKGKTERTCLKEILNMAKNNGYISL